MSLLGASAGAQASSLVAWRFADRSWSFARPPYCVARELVAGGPDLEGCAEGDGATADTAGDKIARPPCWEARGFKSGRPNGCAVADTACSDAEESSAEAAGTGVEYVSEAIPCAAMSA